MKTIGLFCYCVQATRGGEGGPLEQAYVLRDLDDFGLRNGSGSVVPEEELQGDLKEGGASKSQLQGVGLDDAMPDLHPSRRNARGSRGGEARAGPR